MNIVDLRDGDEVLHTGHILELQRPKRIVFDFAVPKYSAEVTVVEIAIQPCGTGSNVTLIDRSVPKEWLDGATAEWIRIFGVADSVTAGR